MRWKSWLPRSSKHLSVVAGLDVSSGGCHLVILSGSPLEATRVCCSEYLEVPEAWLSLGRIVQPDLFGHWMREHLAQGAYDIGALCMGIDDAAISVHEVELAVGLSDQDVAFQLSVEIQALLPDADVCVDFQLMRPVEIPEGPLMPMLQSYQVHVAPRTLVSVMKRMAKVAGLDLTVVEGRSAAQRRMQMHRHLLSSPTVNVDMTEQYEVALGLALGAWQGGAFNFLPHRERAHDVTRRAWYLAVTAWALGGMFFAAGLSSVLSSMLDSRQSRVAEAAEVAGSLEAASQSHSQALSLHQAATEQARWLQARQSLHHHTLKWAHVLNQATQGIWVASVTQQGAQWDVQGEALTSAHAHALLAQLKVLNIWVRSPEMRQLQLLRPVENTGLPVWQFRIEAELKAVQ